MTDLHIHVDKSSKMNIANALESKGADNAEHCNNTKNSSNNRVIKIKTVRKC